MQTTIKQKKVKFATRADPKELAALRKIAGQEDRQLQVLVDEALRDSMVQYDSLYRELAK